MNRQLAELYSAGLPADRQGELYHRYVLALYRMQEKLVETFPNLLIENCSGGGARFDPGMLYYSPQIWTSDDTDAIERLSIQEGTAMIYPLSTMGAHVSDCPNHAVGRVTPFKTRGHVALAGTFGYELDITKIPVEERAQIPFQVAQYHKYNDLVREGNYYRLASFSDNGEYDAWMVVSQDGTEALVTYVDVFKHPNVKSRRLLLQGLDASKEYKDAESGKIYGGDTLMYAGYPLPSTWGDFKSTLIHLIMQ
jgi:alpha-galactosidase